MTAFGWVPADQDGDDSEFDVNSIYGENPQVVYGPTGIQLPEPGPERAQRPHVSNPTAFCPAPDDVIVETIVLELPFDLGIPSDKGHVQLGERSDNLGSWSPEGQYAIVPSEVLSDKLSPMWRLRFRRGETFIAAPNLAADRAFGSWASPYHTDEQWRARNETMEQIAADGMRVVRTVVACTRWYDAALWPSTGESIIEHVGVHVDESISRINDLITAIMVSSGRVELRRIERADLPAVCPFMVDALDPNVGVTASTHGAIPIHANLDDPGWPVLSPNAFAHATLIASQHWNGEGPFFPFQRIFTEAEHHRRSHSWNEAVVSVGTAVEVFVATVIREAKSRQGASPTSIDDLFKSGFKALLTTHLKRCIADPTHHQALSDAADTWANSGYQLRNQCVHSGYAASAQDAETAATDAVGLFGAVEAGLRAAPSTAPIADKIWMGVP